MKFLLDTHTFLWMVENSPRLSATVHSLVTNALNELLLSNASIWELSIKVSLGKFKLIKPIDTFFREQMQLLNIQPLAIMLEHIASVSTLPWHHRDPFDRMLIAQAMVENIPILSADQAFDAYTSIQRIW